MGNIDWDTELDSIQTDNAKLTLLDIAQDLANNTMLSEDDYKVYWSKRVAAFRELCLDMPQDTLTRICFSFCLLLMSSKQWSNAYTRQKQKSISEGKYEVRG